MAKNSNFNSKKSKVEKKSKKSKIEPIVNGLNEEFIVEKSRPLMLMRDVPFSLGELKVLDTYISRINSRDPSHRTVRFSKEEYEKLMGIERMRPERLNKYIIQLQGRVVVVPDKTAYRGWRNYTLFNYSELAPDDNGQWWIDLTCSNEAKKLFFNLQGIGYLRYQLSNVINLTSKYSVLLYCYLLDNRFRHTWDIPLEQFQREVLRMTSEFYLSNYKNFNQQILAKALAEVNQKTDIEFSVSPVRAGRRIVALRWELLKDNVLLPPEPEDVTPEVAQITGQMTIDDIDQLDLDIETTPEHDDLLMLCELLPKDFTVDQVKFLKELAYKWVPYVPNDPIPRNLRVADWLDYKVKLMHSQKQKVRNEFAWLKKACAENWER